MNLKKRYFSDYHKLGGIKELLILALPMIISTACDGVMTFTDRLFLARVGSEQMNAAMGGGVTMQMLMFFFTGVTGYTTALAAQYFGANQKSSTTVAAFQAIIVAIVAWPIILLLKPFTSLYFQFMHIPTAQIDYQIEYLNILAWGSVFGMLRYTLGCYFVGIGKTKIVMLATITAMLTNVVLDYILIFGKLGLTPMGVSGAALATVLGSVSATIMLTIAYLNKSNREEFEVMHSFRFNWDIMKRLLRFGYPAGLEMFLNFFAFATMISLFYSRGDQAATATTIMFNWDMVSFIPLLGIEVAVTSLVGRYMGAGRPQVAHRAALSGIKAGLFYSTVILILFLLIPEALVRLFHPNSYNIVFEEAVQIAVTMVKLAAIYVLVEAVMVALVGALRGAGDTLFTMIASVSAHWLFVPILYLSLNQFNLSIELSWLMIIIAYLLFCSVLVIRFQNGKWKLIKVIHS